MSLSPSQQRHAIYRQVLQVAHDPDSSGQASSVSSRAIARYTPAFKRIPTSVREGVDTIVALMWSISGKGYASTAVIDVMGESLRGETFLDQRHQLGVEMSPAAAAAGGAAIPIRGSG